jgi:hypothetical protein
VRENRLHFTYNYVATEITTITAEVALPEGHVHVRALFTRTGSGGELELFYDDVPVGQGVIATTTPLTYGTPGFAVGIPAGRTDRRATGRTMRTRADDLAPRRRRSVGARSGARRSGALAGGSWPPSSDARAAEVALRSSTIIVVRGPES